LTVASSRLSIGEIANGQKKDVVTCFRLFQKVLSPTMDFAGYKIAARMMNHAATQGKHIGVDSFFRRNCIVEYL